MPILNTLSTVAKAGIMRRLMRGRLGTAFLAIWAGKKMYNYVQARRVRRARMFV